MSYWVLRSGQEQARRKKKAYIEILEEGFVEAKAGEFMALFGMGYEEATQEARKELKDLSQPQE